MNKILSQVRNLSLITHLMMLRLQYPEELNSFFGKIFEFVTFDVIPTEYIYPHILVDLDEESFSEQAEKIGYESVYFIPNSGSITIFIFICLFTQLLFAGLSKVLPEGRVLRYVNSK